MNFLFRNRSINLINSFPDSYGLARDIRRFIHEDPRIEIEMWRNESLVVDKPAKATRFLMKPL